MGKLIVIEGTDGSGKATQAKMLAQALKAREITFPNYESKSSALVRMYLAGDFGREPSDVNAYAASTFFAVDRYAGFRADWGPLYDAGGVLVADRYTTSNAVHQCCKLAREHWDEYLAWLFDFEYERLGIPRPDLVLYLSVATDRSRELLRSRYHGDAGRMDIHEGNEAYQHSAREAGLYCAAQCGWRVIDCEREGAMLSREQIHSMVLEAAREVLS